MADSMTSRDIEDVLSSIRRLVSEETRTPQRPEASGRAPPAPADKLVLTPDFRVPDVVVAPVEDVAEDEARDAWAGESGLGARIAVLEAAVAQRADEWEPDGSEEAPATFMHHVPHQADAETDHGAEPDPTDDALPEAAPMPADPQDWQPEAAEAAPEPDVAAEVAESPEPLEWQDEPHVSMPPPHPAAEVEEALFEDDGGDDLLDEEVLRDMIREIIRQELQGTLGERITRNVRKLVRAEINRAMATKAFE